MTRAVRRPINFLMYLAMLGWLTVARADEVPATYEDCYGPADSGPADSGPADSGPPPTIGVVDGGPDAGPQPLAIILQDNSSSMRWGTPTSNQELAEEASRFIGAELKKSNTFTETRLFPFRERNPRGDTDIDVAILDSLPPPPRALFIVTDGVEWLNPRIPPNRPDVERVGRAIAVAKEQGFSLHFIFLPLTGERKSLPAEREAKSALIEILAREDVPWVEYGVSSHDKFDLMLQSLHAKHEPPAPPSTPPKASKTKEISIAPTKKPSIAPVDFRVVAVGDDQRWKCSGVLVTGNIVLSARHCLPATRVYFEENVAAGGREYFVTEVIEHPSPLIDVVALAITQVDSIVPLEFRETTNTTPPVSIAKISGFGAVDLDGLFGYGRKHSRILPIDGWGCDDDRQHSTGCAPGSELLLAGSAGRDSCNGDSGGPLFELVKSRNGTLNDGFQCRWRLLGLVSRAIPNGTSRCGEGGIYTRVDAISTWIHSLTMDGHR